MNKMKIVGLFVLSLAPSLMMVAITVDEMRKIAAETGVSFGVVKSKFANMNYADAFKAAVAEVAPRSGGGPVVTPPAGSQGKVAADQAAVKVANEQLKKDEEAAEARRRAALAGQASSASGVREAARGKSPAVVAGAAQILIEDSGVVADKGQEAKALADEVKKITSSGASQQSNTLGRLGNKTSKHRYA